MVKLSARLLILTALVSMFLLLRPGVGRILLKPTGENAFELRTKSVAAEVTIDRQFATTNLTLTFQNETGRRIEADFYYTMPPDTLATYFAYWFGKEKVIARIAEKQRAAQIYQQITSRQRDPALIELVGKNTFRARIFPVMPNSDLKVEMVLVQVLPSDQQGVSYELPLREEKGRELASVNVSVLVKPQANISRVTNNLGLPVTEDERGYHLTLTGTKYRPPKDLRVQVIRKPQPLHAELYAAPSGGPDGFFVLALTPDHSLTKPKVAFSGMSTYHVLPSNMLNVKAFHALTLVGRYKSSGPATVHLTGKSPTGDLTYTQPVTFGAEPVPNNLATKLWAAQRMDYLSKSSKNRKAVLALSHRFTLPSKFSSWLAVPKEEMERHRREQAAAKMHDVAYQLAREITEGRGRGRAAQRLRARLNVLGRQAGVKPADVLRNALYGQMYRMGEKLVAEIAAGRENWATARELQAQWRELCRQAGMDPEKELRRYASYEMEQTARDLVREQYGEDPDPKRVASLKERLQRLERASGKSSREYVNRYESYAVAEALAKKILVGRGKTPAAMELRERLNEVAQRLGRKPQDMLQDHLYSGIDESRSRLATEVAAGRGDAATAKRSRERLNELCREAGLDPKKQLQEAMTDWMHPIAADLVEERHRPKPNSTRVASLRAQLLRLEGAGGRPAKEAIESAESNWKRDEVQRVGDQLMEERQKARPNLARLKQLAQRFVTLNRELGDQSPVTDLRQWQAVNSDLDELQRMISTAKKQRRTSKVEELEDRQARLLDREAELRRRWRWSDPLISIEAPADTRQVVALMPTGEVRPLALNSVTGKWEARFDIPTYLTEGEYTITVIIVLKDGTRKVMTIRYHVDLTPPSGVAQATVVSSEQPTLRLEIEATEDTARVTALLPWGSRVALEPSSQPRRFFALTPVPPAYQGTPVSVTFVLLDRAHNRTTVTVAAE